MVLRPSEQVTDERRIHPENLVVWNEWETMVPEVSERSSLSCFLYAINDKEDEEK